MESGVNLQLVAKPNTEFKVKEVPATPEQTLEAFNRAYDILQNTDETTLRDQDKATKSIVEEVKLHAIDKKVAAGKPIGKYKVEYGDQPGTAKKLYNRQEGLPVDGLVDFLQWKIDSGGLTVAEHGDLAKLRDTLVHRSTRFSDAFSRMGSDRRFERVQHEAYLISIDPNRRTGSLDGDFLKAIDDLSKRRTLSITREKSSDVSVIEPPIAVESDDVYGPGIPDSLGTPSRARRVVNRRIRPRSLKDIADGPPIAVESDDAYGPDIPPDLEVEDVSAESVEEIMHDLLVVGRDSEISKRSTLEARRFIREKIREGKWYDVRTWPRKLGVPITEKMWEDRVSAVLREEMVNRGNSFLRLDTSRTQLRIRGKAFKDGMQFDRSGSDASYQEGQSKIQALRHQIRGDVSIGGQEAREVAADNPVRDRIISEILRPIAEGGLTGSVPEQRIEVQRRLREIINANRSDPAVAELIGANAGEHFATDLFETGERIRADVGAHKYAVDQIDSHVKLYFGNTTWAAENDMQVKGMSDKVVGWLQKRTGSGAAGSPAVVGAATSLAIWGAGSSLRREGKAIGGTLGGYALGSALGGSAVGAVFAAARRNRQMNVDRMTHQAEMTYNAQISSNSPRREKMQRFSYNTVSVDQLLSFDGADAGTELLGGGQRRGVEHLMRNLGDVSNQEALVRRIAEIQARLDYSVQNKVDLVTFQGEHAVESGRLKLIEGIVRAKKALRDAGMSEADLNTKESAFRTSWNEQFEQDIKGRDAEFKKERVKQMAVAGVIGFGTGTVGAVVAQGAIGFIADKLGVDVAPTLLREYLPKLKEHIKLAPSKIPLIGASTASAHEALTTLAAEVPSVPGENIKLGPKHVLQVDGERASVVDSEGAVIGSGNYDAETGQIIFSNVEGSNKDELMSALDSGEYRVDEKKIPSMQESMKGIVQNVSPGEVREMTVAEGIQLTIEGDEVDGIHEIRIAPPDGEVITGTISDNGEIRIDTSGMSEKEIKGMKTALVPLESDFDIATEMIFGKEITQEVKVLGPEGVWNELDQPISGWEWYAYDTPYSEGNELELLTFKKGDALILDMTGMGEAYQQGVEPSPINVPEVIRKDEAVFSFTLPNDPEHPVVIKDSADGVPDGRLVLDPNDNVNYIDEERTMTIGEFSKLIINEGEFDNLKDGDIATELNGRQEVFNLRLNHQNGYVNAGRLADDGSGGKKLQSFATIRGAGNVPETIETSVVGPSKEILVIKPDSEETLQFVVTKKDRPLDWMLVPPPIPVVFFPRLPLEALIRPRGSEAFYGTYGSLTEDEYKDRRSRVLSENPDAHLDEKEEVSEYLANQDRAYIAELESMDSAIASPMSGECRVVFAIPAYEEGKNIRKTLEGYISQEDKSGNPLDPSKFEIIIVENHPATKSKDETESEILAFKAAHPEMRVNYVHKAWAAGEGGVGRARKYGNDLALLRSNKRAAQVGELILVSNDADLDGIANRYVATVIDAFDTDAKLDGVAGKITLDRNFLQKPNLRAAERLFNILNRVIQYDGANTPSEREVRSPGTSGGNSAFRASIFAAIGGYNPKTRLAEDLEIGRMINSARRNEAGRIKFLNAAEVATNPRRYLVAQVQGVPVVEMYHDFVENPSIRHVDNADLLARIPDTLDIAAFQNEVNGLYHLAWFNWIDDHEAIFDRTMRLMGAEYVIEDGNVRVTNVDKLLAGLTRPIPEINPPKS